jgi:hypothetical protein
MAAVGIFSRKIYTFVKCIAKCMGAAWAQGLHEATPPLKLTSK